MSKKEIKISKLNSKIGDVSSTDIIPIVSNGKTLFTTVKELLRYTFKVDDSKLDSVTGWSSQKISLELNNVAEASEIDDASTTLTNTWSSSKIDSQIKSSLQISKPIITSPISGSENYSGSITSSYITSSTFTGIQDYVKWEAGNGDFSIIYDSYEGSNNLLSWSPSLNLDTATVYVRVMQGSDNHRSLFSEPIYFVTPDIYIETPTVIVEGSPSNTPINPTIYTSAFSVHNSTDTHISTDWEVVRVIDSVVVWESLLDTLNLTYISIPLGVLETNTEYIFRAKHNSLAFGSSDYGFETSSTINAYTIIPTLSVEGSPLDVPDSPILSTSSFSTFNDIDTHISSSWYIRDAGTIIWSSTNDEINLSSIIVPSGILSVSSTYSFEVIHTGIKYGDSEVSIVSATTKENFIDTPTISIISNINESSQTIGTITNYDPTATYTISTILGSIEYLGGNTFTYVSPDVLTNTTDTISIFSTINLNNSLTSYTNINILDVAFISDAAIIITDFSNFELNTDWDI